MDIDWTQIKGALSRIEKQLSKARQVIRSSDDEAFRDWPEVTREELQAAFPNWRAECGEDWLHDFMEKRIGRQNYRARQGSRKYRISPECWKALDLGHRIGVREMENAHGEREA